MRWRGYNWVNILFLGSYHVLLLVLLPIYIAFWPQQVGLWLSAAALVALCGTAISAGYHRYYAHRTYRTNMAVETVLLFLGTLNVQGSALKWASDHRLHHRYVDTDKDPYSIEKGFWHAHFIWILKSDNGIDRHIVHDLMKRKLLAFQHRHYGILLVLANLSTVLLFGWLFSDYLGAFVLVFLARLFVNHHTTWFINSLAHTWGVQPYSKEHSAVNNWIISLLTYGEGYHNYHHTFSSDYRNGVRWYQFDPTKIVIWLLAKTGLASGLRTVNAPIVTRTLIAEDKKLMLARLKEIAYVRRDVLERRIAEAADSLHEKLARIGALTHERKLLRQRRARTELRNTKAQIRELNRSLRQDFKAWLRLCDGVLNLRPDLS